MTSTSMKSVAGPFPEKSASLIEVGGAQVRHGDADTVGEQRLDDPQPHPARPPGHNATLFVRSLTQNG